MQHPHPHFEHERIARAALTLAGVKSPERQREIVSELFERLDRTRGLARRDSWLRQAYDLIGHHAGSVRILAEALADYHTRTWWRHSCLRTPPSYSPPLRVAFFEVCRACDEAGCALPGERHRHAPRPVDLQSRVRPGLAADHRMNTTPHLVHPLASAPRAACQEGGAG